MRLPKRIRSYNFYCLLFYGLQLNIQLRVSVLRFCINAHAQRHRIDKYAYIYM